MVQFHATTICAVKRPDGDICIGGDGQLRRVEILTRCHAPSHINIRYIKLISKIF